MVSAGELSGFVAEMQEQKSDDLLWSFFLSKVDGKTFADWKREALAGASSSARADATPAALESIIADSLAISNSIAAKEVADR